MPWFGLDRRTASVARDVLICSLLLILIKVYSGAKRNTIIIDRIHLRLDRSPNNGVGTRTVPGPNKFKNRGKNRPSPEITIEPAGVQTLTEAPDKSPGSGASSAGHIYIALP